MTAVKVHISRKKVIFIIGLYRPPLASLDQALDLLARNLESLPNKDICILGDINVNRLVASNENKKLNELLSQFNISRSPLPATRITANSATSIDIICTNMCPNRISYQVVESGLSDHRGQLCSIGVSLKKRTQSFSFRRALNNNNLLALNDLLSIQSWDRVYQATDIEVAYSNLIGIFVTALDITCPLTKTRNRNNHFRPRTTFSPELTELRTSFLQAKEQYNNSGTAEDKIITSQKKKSYDLKLQELRKEATQQHIIDSNNKNRAIWQIINRERSSKKAVSETVWRLDTPDGVVEDLSSIAEHFNFHFNTIADNTLQRNNLQTVQPYDIADNFQGEELSNFKLTSTKEVLTIIDSMKSSSSSGIDGISSKLIKLCKDKLCQPLTNVINRSLVLGVFPSQLKLSKIHPLHKQGCKTDINNFRPISLIPTISKIIEKIILLRLFDHLTSNNILPKGQHGFVPGKSTSTALSELVEYIIDKLEDGCSISNVFLDLSKAFDCLSHNMIISKIRALGVKGTAIKWFESYLTGRKQIVELKQVQNGVSEVKVSTEKLITRGVPQGSVLGPVLFILFTGDLQNYLKDFCHSIMYADDTVLITSSNNREALEISTFISVNVAQQYCLGNDLVFNPSKTKLLNFGRLKDDISEPPDLERVEETKYLGLILDQQLSWNSHIDILCSKLSTALFALRRVKATASPNILKTAYYALFETHIRYGITLWGGSSNSNLNRVLVLQKKAVRLMANLPPRESCREAFKNLQILTVGSIYIVEVISYALKQGLIRNESRHHHFTRQAQDYHLPAHRSALFTKKPSYVGARLFNKLPQDFKNCTIPKLKKKLQTWFLATPIYRLEEFFESF